MWWSSPSCPYASRRAEYKGVFYPKLLHLLLRITGPITINPVLVSFDFGLILSYHSFLFTLCTSTLVCLAMRKLFFAQTLGLLFGLGHCAPSADADILPRQAGGGPTCNTPDNRACWNEDFNITTDYEVKIPETGNVVRVGYHAGALSVSCL